MKKSAIILFIILLVAVSYNVLSKDNDTTAKNELNDSNSIEYRVSEKQNLIIEDEPVAETDEALITEDDFTAYIEEVNQDVETLTEKEELSPLDKETLTNTFITLTDFIFYDGKIKGKTFDELTNDAKEKVIDLYEKIDAKIENVYPGYKEKIKETSIKTYNNVKEKLVELKDNIATSYKDEIGEERYNDQVETFNESKETMKESFEPVVDVIVEESKELYNTAKEKADNWYQTWKEENS